MGEATMKRLGLFVVFAYCLTAAPVYGRVAKVSVEQCVRNADTVCICTVEHVEQETNTVTAIVERSLKGKPGECSPEQIRKCHGDNKEHPCESKAK